MTAVRDIIQNTNSLPENIKNELLVKLADNEYSTSDALAEVITGNYDRLPPDVRNKLLVKLADNESAAKGIAEVITGNYDRLPPDVRNKLLVKLADNESAIGALAWAAANDFDKLPTNIQDLSLKLADDADLSWTLVKGIIDNYQKLSKNHGSTILFKLAGHDYAAASLAREMTMNYDRLPPDVRNKLLVKLANNKYAENEVTALIKQNYHKLPSDIKEQLHRKLDLNFSDKTKRESSLTQSGRPPYRICVICGQKRVPAEKRFGKEWGYRRIQKCDNCIFVEERLFEHIKIRKRKLPKKVEEAETVFMILDLTANELVEKSDNPEDLRKKIDLYRARNPKSDIQILSMKYSDFTDVFIRKKSPDVQVYLSNEIRALSK